MITPTNTNEFGINFPAPLTCSYREADRLRKESAPLDPRARVWYQDALAHRIWSPVASRRVGISGLSRTAHHLIGSVLAHVNGHWLLRLETLEDFERITGHREAAIRCALRDLTGEGYGPKLLHVIEGPASGERVFQIIEPPLSMECVPPAPRPTRLPRGRRPQCR